MHASIESTNTEVKVITIECSIFLTRTTNMSSISEGVIMIPNAFLKREPNFKVSTSASASEFGNKKRAADRDATTQGVGCGNKVG